MVERRAHAESKTVHAAFMAGFACPECGLDPATVVAARAIGLVGAAPKPRPTPTADRKRTLEKQLAKASADVEGLQGEIQALRDPN